MTITRHTTPTLAERLDAAGVEYTSHEVVDLPLAPPARCTRCQCWLRRTRDAAVTLCSPCRLARATREAPRA